MRRAAIAIPLVVVFAAAAAGAIGWQLIRGGAHADFVPEERPLAPFHALSVEGTADVTLEQGAVERAYVESSLRQRDALQLAVRDGVLHVGYNQHRRWWLGGIGSARSPRLRIVFRDLDTIRAQGSLKLVAERLAVDRLAIDVAGGAKLRVGDLQVNYLEIDGSGAIDADLAGRAREQAIHVSGAASYHAPDLVSDDVAVDVSGAARVVVRAEKTLKVSLSGAGNVEYLGNPQVTQQVSGVGHVKRRSE